VFVSAVVALAVVGVLAAMARPPTADPAASTGIAPRQGCPTVVPPAADVDGDGCEEPVRWVAGVIEAGSARFALGGPGDAWAVGDWDCDGRRTPALLHGGTLEVFDDWPRPGGEQRGRPVAAAAGATGLTVVPGPTGCERPSLTRPGAADLVVDARGSP
jgi:hypothetical protein